MEVPSRSDRHAPEAAPAQQQPVALAKPRATPVHVTAAVIDALEDA
jgi:hypothetical protein